VVTRSAEHIDAVAEPFHVVHVLVSGRSRVVPADGRPAFELGPGDIAYWTSLLPYRWEFDGPFVLLVLRVPFPGLEVAPAVLRPVEARPLSSASGFARLVVPLARDALDDPALLSGAAGTRVIQNIVALFTTVLVAEL